MKKLFPLFVAIGLASGTLAAAPSQTDLQQLQALIKFPATSDPIRAIRAYAQKDFATGVPSHQAEYMGAWIFTFPDGSQEIHIGNSVSKSSDFTIDVKDGMQWVVHNYPNGWKVYTNGTGQFILK